MHDEYLEQGIPIESPNALRRTLKAAHFRCQVVARRNRLFSEMMPRLTRSRPASNCTESQIVVRNRPALPQKHRNDSRHDLDIGFLIDRDPGAGMGCGKTNTSSGN